MQTRDDDYSPPPTTTVEPSDDDMTGDDNGGAGEVEEQEEEQREFSSSSSEDDGFKTPSQGNTSVQDLQQEPEDVDEFDDEFGEFNEAQEDQEQEQDQAKPPLIDNNDNGHNINPLSALLAEKSSFLDDDIHDKFMLELRDGIGAALDEISRNAVPSDEDGTIQVLSNGEDATILSSGMSQISLHDTDKSASGFWESITSLPDVQPVDWKRSAMRRRFLVALGIPVDLDEVLPKKRRKKMVISSSSSADKEATSSSATSPENNFDMNGSQRLANVSEAALNNMTGEELRAHSHEVKSVIGAAKDTLELLKTRRDSALQDKQAFESVIQSLVDYAQRMRNNTTKMAALPPRR